MDVKIYHLGRKKAWLARRDNDKHLRRLLFKIMYFCCCCTKTAFKLYFNIYFSETSFKQSIDDWFYFWQNVFIKTLKLPFPPQTSDVIMFDVTGHKHHEAETPARGKKNPLTQVQALSCKEVVCDQRPETRASSLRRGEVRSCSVVKSEPRTSRPPSWRGDGAQNQNVTNNQWKKSCRENRTVGRTRILRENSPVKPPAAVLFRSETLQVEVVNMAL